ncbi:TPA: hypothetical protein DF272_01435 [Candidatus Falkowbacteria bacterium]|nr:hypothetical protein [Candidatus Falkowbacteria bacterium]
MSRTHRRFVKTIGRDNNHCPKRWFRAARENLRRPYRWTEHAGGSHALSDESIMPCKVARKLLAGGRTNEQVISCLTQRFAWTPEEAQSLVAYLTKND